MWKRYFVDGVKETDIQETLVMETSFDAGNLTLRFVTYNYCGKTVHMVTLTYNRITERENKVVYGGEYFKLAVGLYEYIVHRALTDPTYYADLYESIEQVGESPESVSEYARRLVG